MDWISEYPCQGQYQKPSAQQTINKLLMSTLTLVILWLLGVVGVLLGIFVVMMLINQRQFIYVPYFPAGSKSHVDTPDRWGMPNWENVYFESADGTRLHGYWIAFEDGMSSLKAKSTLLFCHANAGNMGHRLPTVALMRQSLHCNVFIFSYRGYGHSADVAPTELGLKADAKAAFEWMIRKSEQQQLPITVYGQSIGGAIAIWLASVASERIDLLAVENTFTSLPALVPVHFPLLTPFVRFCSERWESAHCLEQMLNSHSNGKVPFVLLLAGQKDEIVPNRQMLKLAEICKRKEAKYKLSLFPSGTHNDTWMQNGYFASFPTAINAQSD
jgi:fermentation-respiration switch protein FrsA (DUF1100 family)